MATVFLDLDGTLTDAGEGILNSVDYALRKLRLPGLSGDNRWIVGPPLWPSFAQLGVQNGSKIEKKWITNCIIFLPWSLIDFLLILGGFWVGFGGHVGTRNR